MTRAQRAACAEARQHRQEISEQIVELTMRFILREEDFDCIGKLQREYHALLLLGNAAGNLTVKEKKMLNSYNRMFRRS